MSQLLISSETLTRIPSSRVVARLPAQARWSEKGKEVVVEGSTENVGTVSAMVFLRPLPPVGSIILLQLTDGSRASVEVKAEVIRVERDPALPLAALSIISNQKQWQQAVWERARAAAAKPISTRDDDVVM
ncbi:MAG: hypothetical protein H0W76_24485 [Pyrinomonadaceae bacterium]|nr:hypothetical protein [Pyrinomonadaceae bacterium]